jgi:hypothetical protein
MICPSIQETYSLLHKVELQKVIVRIELQFPVGAAELITRPFSGLVRCGPRVATARL